jgi:hypothetical protein
LGSPFAFASWLAITVSREIADLGTLTPPDLCEDEQLGRPSIAMTSSATTRIRPRVAPLTVRATFQSAALFHSWDLTGEPGLDEECVPVHSAHR